MLGRRSGVSKILTDKVPFLVYNHCIAHRLARAYSKAANELVYLKKFKNETKREKEEQEYIGSGNEEERIKGNMLKEKKRN